MNYMKHALQIIYRISTSVIILVLLMHSIIIMENAILGKRKKKQCFFCCTLLFFNVLTISFPICKKNRRGKPLKAKPHLFTQISTSFFDEYWPLFRYKKVKDKNKYIILMVSITLWWH